MSDESNGRRRRFSAQEKVAILRQHFIDKTPVSQVCDQHGLSGCVQTPFNPPQDFTLRQTVGPVVVNQNQPTAMRYPRWHTTAEWARGSIWLPCSRA